MGSLISMKYVSTVPVSAGRGRAVLTRPFYGDRGRRALGVIRFTAKDSVAAQFAQERHVDGTTVTPWPKTKAFGNRPAPAKTLQRTGAYRRAFLGQSSQGYQKITEKAIEFGPDPAQVPHVKVFQKRGRGTRVKADPTRRVEGTGPLAGRLKMVAKLGMEFGVWVSERKALKGWIIKPRRVGFSQGMHDAIFQFVAREFTKAFNR